MRRTMNRRQGLAMVAAALVGLLAGARTWAAGCDRQPGCGPHGSCHAGGCGKGHLCRGNGHCGHCGECNACCPKHHCPGDCCRKMHDLAHRLCEKDVYEKRYFLRAQGKSWHSPWYDPAEGRPIALVVPPTAEFQTQYSWGVPSSRVAPIYHQFRRPYPGPGAIGGGVGGGGMGLMPTPMWPSDTVQFGVNAVRGPWGAY